MNLAKKLVMATAIMLLMTGIATVAQRMVLLEYYTNTD